LQAARKALSAQQNIDGLHVWDKPGLSGYLVSLVCLVYLVCFVYLVSFVQPKNQTNMTNQTNKTDALKTLEGFFSILLRLPP